MLRRILLPLLVCLVAFGAFQWKIQEKMVDFEVYRTAATRAIHAEPLFRDSDGHYQFKYLPVFAMATIPFALVDDATARVIWFALTVGMLVFFLRFSARFLPERRRGLGLIIGLSFLFMGKFFVHELLLGQVNIAFGLLIVCAIGALQAEIPSVAGVLIAAAVCVKPYGVLFAPWLLFSEDRRTLTAFTIAFAIAIVAPALVYGFGGNAAELRGWWQTVTSTTAPNLLGTDNVSFASMWAKWIGPGKPATVLAALSGIASLGLVANAWRTRKEVSEPAYLEAAALLILVPLLSPQGWDYVLLLATPAVALLIDRAPELSPGWRAAVWSTLIVTGFMIFDLVGRRIYREFMELSVMTLVAVGFVILLGQLRRQRLA